MTMIAQARIASTGAVTLLLSSLGGTAFAQYAPVDPIPMGQTATGVMANKLSGDIASGKKGGTAVSSRCLADSGPGPERRAMEADYARRLKSSGKAAADSWREQQGRTYRAALVAAGKCPRASRQAGRNSGSQGQAAPGPSGKLARRGCSADALPMADRRRLEADYARRAKAEGKAAADKWVRAEGTRYHRKLVDQGICPAS